MRAALLVMMLCGCGRLSFDAGPSGSDAASIDAAPCVPFAGCPGAYAIECGSGCYTVCPTPADQPTQDARCQAAGQHLAVILDATTNGCVTAALTSSPSWYWIGLVQASTATTPGEGWSWVTGEPLGYADWRDPDPMPPPNPDDYDGIENGFEQCAWMGLTTRWEDASCDNTAPGVVCER